MLQTNRQWIERAAREAGVEIATLECYWAYRPGDTPKEGRKLTWCFNSGDTRVYGMTVEEALSWIEEYGRCGMSPHLGQYGCGWTYSISAACRRRGE